MSDEIATPLEYGFYVIRKTKVGAYEVSTCAVGDYAETMIFNDVTGETNCFEVDLFQRHKTREDAEAWHASVVNVMRDKFDA